MHTADLDDGSIKAKVEIREYETPNTGNIPNMMVGLFDSTPGNGWIPSESFKMYVEFEEPIYAFNISFAANVTGLLEIYPYDTYSNKMINKI